jgi:hypothetical protein
MRAAVNFMRIGLLASLATAGCGGDDAFERPLRHDQFIAACITDPDTELHVELCILDLDGQVRLTGHSMEPGIRPALSGDRSRVAFADSTGIQILDLSTGRTNRIDLRVIAIDWSEADESLIAIGQSPTGSRSIMAVSFEGDIRVMTTGSSVAIGRSLSATTAGPDVVFEAVERGKHVLLRTSAATDDPRELYSSTELLSHVSWSRSVADIVLVEGPSRLLAVNAESGVASTLIEEGRAVASPSVSPDGSRVLYSLDDGRLRYLVAQTGATADVPVSQRSMLVALPVWS